MRLCAFLILRWLLSDPLRQPLAQSRGKSAAAPHFLHVLHFLHGYNHPTHHSNFVRTVIARIGFDLYAIDLYTPMVYNPSMLFVETRLFTSRILDAMMNTQGFNVIFQSIQVLAQ